MCPPIYEYKCVSCGLVRDELRNMDERETNSVCPVCQSEMWYKLSASQIRLEGVTGDFPGAHSKWEKVRRQKMQQEAKRES